MKPILILNNGFYKYCQVIIYFKFCFPVFQVSIALEYASIVGNSLNAPVGWVESRTRARPLQVLILNLKTLETDVDPN